jgi:hypothetical protein
MGSMNFRGFALGLTAAATVLLRHPVGAEKQADLSSIGPTAPQGA